MSNNKITDLEEWTSLEQHKTAIADVHMRDLFAADPQRFDTFSIALPGLLFDYSKHKITKETFEKLISLAKARDVEGQIVNMARGAPINTTEKRAALHMALRGSIDNDVVVGGEIVADFVKKTLAQVKTISEEIRGNKTITDVVNIGIGGSDLGPRMVYKALKPFADGPNVHFISNVDGSALAQLLKKLKAENTVFIIASKSFSTQETMANATVAIEWLKDTLEADALASHLVAISANADAAIEFGVSPERVLPMRDWVGGRYSLWSAIGLPVAVAFGFETFEKLLDGGRAMDYHFMGAPMEKNIPVIMALLGVWYRNFWDYPAQAILPYSHDLRDFPIFMQQLDMESNGKAAAHKTGAIVFGEAGTNAQHTFMQLLHQSNEIVPADFIMFAQPHHSLTAHHEKLLGHALAQSRALMNGKPNTEQPHRNFPGNRPSSTLIFDTLDAYHLGMLIALYEHKVFVQGVIWGINSFDQWGVELGKVTAEQTIEVLEKNEELSDSDPSTSGLLAHIHQKFIKS